VARAAELPADLSADEEARSFADLFFAQGLARLGQGEAAAALPALERAAATWPKDPTYRYFVALCEMRLDRLDAAVADLEALLGLAGSRLPESRLRSTLGEALWRKGDLARAERELREAIRLDVRDALAHFYLGLARLDQGDETEAFVEIGRAAALDPSLGSTAAYYLGVGAVRDGDEALARASFARAAGAPHAVVARASGDWLALLETPAERFDVPPAELRFGAFAGHDGNPARLGDPPPAGAPFDASDRVAVLRARFALHPVRRGGWTVGLIGQGYVSHHDGFDAGDLRGVQGVAVAAWGSDRAGFLDGPLGFVRVPVGTTRVSFLVQAGSTRFDADGDLVRSDHEASAALFLHEGRRGKTRIEGQFGDVGFEEDAVFDPLEGETVTGRVGQTFYLGRPQRYLRLDVSRADTSAELGGLERETDRVLGELALPLGGHVTFFLYANLARVEWDDASAALFGVSEPREDDELNARAAVAIVLARHVYLTLEAARGEREVGPDSLDPLFGYEQDTASAGITAHW